MPEFAGSADEDRKALEALFDATGGLEWQNNTGWKTDPDLGGWHGVAVNEQGRVGEIWLALNGLEGILSSPLSCSLYKNAVAGVHLLC